MKIKNLALLITLVLVIIIVTALYLLREESDFIGDYANDDFEVAEQEKEDIESLETSDDWNDFDVAIDELEKTFDCMEEAGAYIEPIMENYFKCSMENCMDFTMSDEDIDLCIEDCFSLIDKELEKELTKLKNNKVFTDCIEEN